MTAFDLWMRTPEGQAALGITVVDAAPEITITSFPADVPTYTVVVLP